MQRSEVVVSAAGPSAPIVLLGGNTNFGLTGPDAAAAYALSASAWGHLSAGAALNWQFEITADLPDANGNWPVPGNWITYQDGTVLPHSSSFFMNLVLMSTAIRVNVLTYTSGSLTFRVLQ